MTNVITFLEAFMASRLTRGLVALVLGAGVLTATIVTASPAGALPAGIYTPNRPNVPYSSEDMPVTGDWDGNGYIQPGIVRSNGTNYLWFLYPSTNPIYFGNQGDIPVPGDYSYALLHDLGISEPSYSYQTQIAVYRPSTGVWYILAPDHVTMYSIQWGTPGDIPVPADYLGADLYGRWFDFAIFRPSNQTVYIDSNGTMQLAQNVSGGPGSGANPQYIAYQSRDLADHNDLGTPALLVTQPQGTNSQTPHCVAGQGGGAACSTWTGFGNPTDQLALYDYGITVISQSPPDTLSHVSSISVFRPSNGTWYVRVGGDTTQVAQTVQYGVNGDYEVAGNWNGPTGYGVVETNLAVFRPCNGTWYIHGRGGSADSSIQFGVGIGGC